MAALGKMKAIDRMKDEFVSTASHELRTPLSVVRENMSLIEDGVVGPIESRQKKLLETSRLNVDRLANILDNLLDISKIQSQSLELHREKADLGQVAAKAVELLKHSAERKNISLETKLPEKVIAWIDPEQVLRIFINLLDNAVKYTDQNGKIVVGVENFGNRVEAYVSDNGRGIPKINSHRIFERFVHADKEDGIFVKGAGLGLSICKGIIEMHSGRIWHESPPAGADKGAKFIFSLPKQ